MRGLPWLQLVIISVVFLGLGWPIQRLLRPKTAQISLPSAVSPENKPAGGSAVETPLKIDVLYTSSPAEIELQCVDQTLLDAHDPTGGSLHAEWKAALPKEGIDLTFQARWTEADNATAPAKPADPAAVRIGVVFPDGHRQENTFWSADRRPLTELVTILPNPPADAP